MLKKKCLMAMIAVMGVSVSGCGQAEKLTADTPVEK